MKVLLISSKFPPEYSGSGLRAYKTYKRLKSKFDIDYDVVANSEEFNNNLKYVFDGVVVERLGKRLEIRNIKGTIGRIIRSLIICLNYFINGYQIIQILRRRNYDLIHTFGDSIPIHAALFYSKRKNISIAREICNQETTPIPILPFRLHKIIKFKFGNNSKIVSISKGITNNCIKNDVPIKLIWERPNPVDEKIFNCLKDDKYELRRKNCKFTKNDIIILNISKFRPSKNQSFLIDVLRHLDEKYKLLLCGPLVKGGPKYRRDVEYFKSILNKIETCKLEERVQVKEEFIENVEDYYKLADVFAFPTLIEALGTPMLESIACGVPVVANLIEGVTDIWIKNGRNGYTCKMFEKDFADCIKKSVQIENDALETESEKILKLASTEVIDEEYYSLFLALLGKAKGEVIE